MERTQIVNFPALRMKRPSSMVEIVTFAQQKHAVIRYQNRTIVFYKYRYNDNIDICRSVYCSILDCFCKVYVSIYTSICVFYFFGCILQACLCTACCQADGSIKMESSGGALLKHGRRKLRDPLIRPDPP